MSLSRNTLLLIFFLLGLSGTVIFIGVRQRSVMQSLTQLQRRQMISPTETAPTPIPSPTPIRLDPNGPNGDTEALKKRIQDLETTILQLQQVSTLSARTNENSEKDFSDFSKQILYLGSADTTNRDWTPTNLEITLNSNDYPSDVRVTFEAGLSILGGEAWVRLKNKTTGAVVTASEISHNTSTITWKTSAPFSLYEGSHMYVVELRSSSGEKVQLNGARVILE